MLWLIQSLQHQRRRVCVLAPNSRLSDRAHRPAAPPGILALSCPGVSSVGHGMRASVDVLRSSTSSAHGPAGSKSHDRSACHPSSQTPPRQMHNRSGPVLRLSDPLDHCRHPAVTSTQPMLRQPRQPFSSMIFEMGLSMSCDPLAKTARCQSPINSRRVSSPRPFTSDKMPQHRWNASDRPPQIAGPSTMRASALPSPREQVTAPQPLQALFTGHGCGSGCDVSVIKAQFLQPRPFAEVLTSSLGQGVACAIGCVVFNGTWPRENPTYSTSITSSRPALASWTGILEAVSQIDAFDRVRRSRRGSDRGASRLSAIFSRCPRDTRTGFLTDPAVGRVRRPQLSDRYHQSQLSPYRVFAVVVPEAPPRHIQEQTHSQAGQPHASASSSDTYRHPPVRGGLCHSSCCQFESIIAGCLYSLVSAPMRRASPRPVQHHSRTKQKGTSY